MRAIDTNVLVRVLARDDAVQVARAEAFIGASAWVSQLVLAETLRVLESVYHRTPAQLAAALDAFKRRPALGFSDCLVLEIARKAGHLPLGTFDKGLAKLAGATQL